MMVRFIYKDIIQNTTLPYAKWEIPLQWRLQHNHLNYIFQTTSKTLV